MNDARPAGAPLVSVLVRSTDRPTLQRALDSVAAQDYSFVEVVVVTACGSRHRELPQHCGRFPMRLMRSAQALPRAEAANAALDAARGDWFNFLDDDDEFLPTHLSHMVAALCGKGECKLAFCEAQIVDADAAPVGRFGRAHFPLELFEGSCFTIHAALFARDLVEQGARFDGARRVHEDLDFWIQCANLTPFLYVPQAGVRWHLFDGLSPASPGQNQDLEAVRRELAELQEKRRPWASRVAASIPGQFWLGRRALHLARWDEARACMRKVLAAWPAEPDALNFCGLAELRCGDAMRASELFQRALARVPGHPGILQNIALANAALARNARGRNWPTG